MNRIYIADMSSSSNGMNDFFRTVLSNASEILTDQIDNKDTSSPIPISNSSIRSPDYKRRNKDFCFKFEVEKIDEECININIPIKKDNYTCCVCFEEIESNIYSCINYHSLCKTCDKHLKKRVCPICRNSDIRRNHILESAVNKLKIRCPNEYCNKKMFKDTLDIHIKQCIHTKIKCHYCSEDVSIKNYLDHLKNNCSINFQQIKPFEEFIPEEKNNIIIRSESIRSLIMCHSNGELYCFTDNDKHFDSEYIYFKIYENNKITYVKVFVNKVMDLIENKGYKYTLLDNEKNKTLTFGSFIDKYPIGSKWMICNRCGLWKEGSIVKKLYKPERVLVKYSDTTNTTFLNNSEWIIVDDNVYNKKIKSMEQYTKDLSVFRL